MENKEYSINGHDFKETKQYKYYTRKSGTVKWNRLNKADYIEAVKLADRPMIAVYVGTIPKPKARKLVRRFVKGKKSAVKFFKDLESVSGLSCNEIKRQLKAA